jgi:hypothetical protein
MRADTRRLRNCLGGADQLAVHDPGRERLEIAGDCRHGGFVEQRVRPFPGVSVVTSSRPEAYATSPRKASPDPLNGSSALAWAEQVEGAPPLPTRSGAARVFHQTCLRIISDLGHLLHWQSPEPVAQALAGFFAGTS